jgi:hypothetical protein
MVGEALAGLSALKSAFDLAKGLKDINESYAGDWVTRSIRRRGEPAFR